MTVPNDYQCPWIKGSCPEEPGKYWVSLRTNSHELHLLTVLPDGFWDTESITIIADGCGVSQYTPAVDNVRPVLPSRR